ncbi:MAG: pectate lyase, partial [Paraglaciecola sp.]|nr:pectate lyase [Paraglaciecola sp.]
MKSLFLIGFFCLLSWQEVRLSNAPEQSVWAEYYLKSAQTIENDQQVLVLESQALDRQNIPLPTPSSKFGFDVNAENDWYFSLAGQHILSALLTWQTPSGGWSKRTDMSVPRLSGQLWGVEPNYVPTFDNHATTSQLHILAKAYTLLNDRRYEHAFYNGLSLILQSQYPNGGWPQNYPLRGNYHDHITFNDGVMVNIMHLLFAVAEAKPPFSFISPEIRQQAELALEKAIKLVIRLQQCDSQGYSLWAAQYHHLTLQPSWARAYEMPALASMESAEILSFLMDLPEPSTILQNRIHAAMAWFERHRLQQKYWHPEIRELQYQADAGPLWPRFAEIGSNKALFGDRDGQI